MRQLLEPAESDDPDEPRAGETTLRFIGMRSPVHLAWRAEVWAVPFNQTAKTVIGYLEKSERQRMNRRKPLVARDLAAVTVTLSANMR